MEFLFLNHNAPVEALLFFVSLFLIAILVSHDTYLFVRKKIIALNPRKAYTIENTELVEENILPVVPEELIEEIKDEKKEDEAEIDQAISVSQNEKEDQEVREKIESEEGDHNNGELLEKEIEATSPESEEKSEEIESEKKREEMGNQESMSEISFVPQKETEETPIAITEAKKEAYSPEKKEKLVEITSNVHTLIARGHIDDARALIISGLAIDKHHRELNLLMASLYERDHSFEKAGFILKELATENPLDIEVLTHLATDLAMQRKYEVAYEIYKKILSLGGETEEILYTLTHLASELALTPDVYTYAKSYLKQYPRNPEILWLYTQSLISLGERREAIETLIKLKNLTPYNQEIVDLISKLVTEEEIAMNFSPEK